MTSSPPRRIKSISEFHQLRKLPKPEHPLVSVINFDKFRQTIDRQETNWTQDFYSIALKRNLNGKIKYGQQEYDFDEGILFFIAPGQVFRIEMSPEDEATYTGWLLLVHPDFLWNTPLAKTIKQYAFFDYAVHEALFLSDKEETTLINLLQQIEQEYHGTIDSFSQEVIIAQLELFLTYAKRFYHRQFLTRNISNHQLLDRLETLLTHYFNNSEQLKHGLPTVQFVADSLNVSPTYLTGLLTLLTGQSTQQHIHEKLIDKAKEQLSITDLSISEIAYQLGFEHPQSFSKLFKAKTNSTPLAFRHSFN